MSLAREWERREGGEWDFKSGSDWMQPSGIFHKDIFSDLNKFLFTFQDSLSFSLEGFYRQSKKFLINYNLQGILQQRNH